MGKSEVITDKKGLEDLALLINDLDIRHGFDQPQFDSRLEDAYGVVFNQASPEAPEAEVVPTAEHMTEAEIAQSLGDGVLESLKDTEGHLDREALQQVLDVRDLYGQE